MRVDDGSLTGLADQTPPLGASEFDRPLGDECAAAPPCLDDPGPLCVDSAAPNGGPIDPIPGGLRLSFRVNYGSTADTIVLQGVALLVE